MEDLALSLAASPVGKKQPAQPGCHLGIHGSETDVVLDGPVKVLFEGGVLSLDPLEHFHQQVGFVPRDVAAVAELGAQSFEFVAFHAAVAGDTFDKAALVSGYHDVLPSAMGVVPAAGY
jgi:hypothetical protein